MESYAKIAPFSGAMCDGLGLGAMVSQHDKPTEYYKSDSGIRRTARERKREENKEQGLDKP
jgi:hypothetical protein